jgi:hypothetical protein
MSAPRWLPWAALAVLIFAGGGAVYSKIRGLRNNNPGNIRRGGERWQGLAPDSAQTDPAFWRFLAPEWGIRAIVRILRTYQARGLVTVRGIIGRWAPPTENDTDAYVAAVARQLNVSPDDVLTLTGDQLITLVKAIIRHENGIQPYSDATITRGIELA